MSALHELLQQLGSPDHGNADHHRAMLALHNRLDLMQAVTVASKRAALGVAIDGAIAPDGRIFIVESNNCGHSRLYAWDNAPLGDGRFISIAAAHYISLCGFPDGKTLAYATYDRDMGGRLHFGDWKSDPIPFRVDNGTLFWQHEGRVHAAVREYASRVAVRLQLFDLPKCAPVSTVNNTTRCHAVIEGKLSWIEEIDSRPHDKLENVHWGEWNSMAHGWIADGCIGVNPRTGKLRYVSCYGNEFRLLEGNESTTLYHMIQWESEGRLFNAHVEKTRTSQGMRQERLYIISMDDPVWSWNHDDVSDLVALCFLPDSGDTALLTNQNSRDVYLNVILLKEDGTEYANERVAGATGRMRRIGTQIAVEGKDDRGPTVTLFRTGRKEGRTTYPLVGRFDRLVLLKDDSVAGWHFSNGVISIQHYC